MAQKTIAGVTVDVNEEGYMTRHDQWTRDLAAAIAAEEGIAELSPGHWRVIDFLQEEYKATGQLPTLRGIKNRGGIPTKDLYDLFPGGPLKLSTKIAGLPKPTSCV